MRLKPLFLISLLALIASPAFGEIGRVKTTLGTASVQRGTDHIPAATGQELLTGDWLETGKDGRLSVTFVDNTRWSVGPDSRIALTKFDYDPTSQHGSFVGPDRARIDRRRVGQDHQDPGAIPYPSLAAGCRSRRRTR